MRPLLILQARMSSSRLPGKVMMQVNGMPMIYWQVKRILRADVGDLIVATTTESSDDILVKFLDANSISYFRGPTNNVAERFKKILENKPVKYFFRLTADCPMLMPEIIRSMNDLFQVSDLDYFSNTLIPSFPDGLDIEIVRTKAFMEIFHMKLSQFEIEHVTQKIIKSPEVFKVSNFKSPKDFSNLRWTVDYIEDFEFILRVFEHFAGREVDFSFEDILQAVESGLIKDNLRSGEFRNIALREQE